LRPSRDQEKPAREVYPITVEEDASPETLKALQSLLREYNTAQAGDGNVKPLRIFIQDDEGQVLGGLSGWSCWGWLHIDTLTLHESLRRLGYGTRLMMMMEEEARKRECTGIYLETYSFQALPFYQKLGYTLFGELDQFPREHKLYFLKKILTEP
jgi:ribosomal protein S18 acetylase RimI-like enzyme